MFSFLFLFSFSSYPLHCLGCFSHRYFSSSPPLLTFDLGPLLGAMVQGWTVQHENGGLSLESSHYVKKARG